MADGTDTVFFDIGDTLGAVRVNPAGTGIEEITVLPGVDNVLATLGAAGIRMGVISDRGAIPASDVEAALERADLLRHLDPAVLVYGPKDSTLIFERAAAQVSTPGRLVFVGEDATERAVARDAGFLVCPHPRLVPGVLLGRAPRFVRIRGAIDGTHGRTVLRTLPLVPLHVDAGTTPPELYALTDAPTALALDDLGFRVDRLGADAEPETGDLYLLRDDGRADGAAASPAGDAPGGSAAEAFTTDEAARRVLASTDEGLYVAVPAGRSVETLHIGSPRHGHNLKLTALPGLLAPEKADGLAAGPDLAVAALSAGERTVIRRQVTASRLARAVERYAGARPLTPGVTLVSRHIHHPDNARAVQGLVDDLGATAGLTVRRHRFTHEGAAHDNVEAVLPGTGPSGVVLLTAHLDSTAARRPGYRPATDPAPGADDDASGVAAVLAAVQAVTALRALDPVPHREFRFVLFNAEEHGLVGSRAYARDEAARGTNIVAVLQLDMVGYDGVPGREFELHAGFTASAAVQKRSIELAELVAAMVPCVSGTLPAPQVHPAPGQRDPAEQRSDHYSFQVNGYPACLASEDFFAGSGPAAPPADANPDYHAPSDTTVDATYARDITRAVTAAAWVCGTR